MKIFTNVKGIELELFFKGDGCVNYDSSDQKFTLSKLGLQCGLHDNVKLAKKEFKQIVNVDNEVETVFKYKVSSECIKHECFKDEIEFENSKIAYLPHILLPCIASPALILRGYMYAGDNTIKKKSPVCITSAKEISPYRRISDIEVHSKSGDRSDTSLYFVENVGQLVYKSNAYIDLTELQFLSDDSTYDRKSIGVDGGENEKIYLTAMRENFGDDIKFGYYFMKKGLAKDEWAERGILLSQKNVDFLVKDMIKRFFKINLHRKDAFFKFIEMKVKVIYGDESYNEEEIILNNINDADNYQFDYYVKYQEANEELIKRNQEKIKGIDNVKQEQKTIKKTKK